jgi:hypothetical protein
MPLTWTGGGGRSSSVGPVRQVKHTSSCNRTIGLQRFSAYPSHVTGATDAAYETLL